MSKHKKKTVSHKFKTLLSQQVGGDRGDWKRISKNSSTWNDIDRVFENKKLGVQVTLSERTDGLFYAELPNGTKLTTRFKKASEPSAVDVVMNAILADQGPDEIPEALLKQALAEGLVNRFKFTVHRMDEDVAEEGEPTLYAVIYPAVRDDTFKCASVISLMAPENSYDVDDCVVTQWFFKDAKTPADVVKALTAKGFTWDKADQKRERALYKEIKSALKPQI